jgi:hypothetical protein
MGIHHHEQETDPLSKLGFHIILQGVRLTIVCILRRYRLTEQCVNINEILVCRLKINHVWNTLSSCVYFLGTILLVAKHLLYNNLIITIPWLTVNLGGKFISFLV